MCPRRERFCDNSRPKIGATMGQVTALARGLEKAPSPQVDQYNGVAVNTRQIAEGAQRAKSACHTFGRFSFHPARQLLLEGETPVRLGSRALEILAALVERPGELVSKDELTARLEILAALVERPGELVSKDELTARVWPNTIVE